MCDERYEDRRWKLTTIDSTSKDDEKGKCFSYFCLTTPDWEHFPKDWVGSYKEGKPRKEVTGQVANFRVNYDKLVNRKWAVMRLKEIMYTKSGKLRKKYLTQTQNESYDTASLMCYLNQAIGEGSDNVLLSWKEYKFLTEG
ncbi:hypothetical protein KUA24_112 [Vibrio phage HNL01]|nr:hypothetical protein KUA24_112 [Vibrio phage HNL01]